MSADKDSAFVQLLHQNKALPISCQITNRKGTFSSFVSKHYQLSKNNNDEPIINSLNDSSLVSKNYYYSADWKEIMSYENNIFRTEKRDKEIYYSNKDSVKTFNQTILQAPVYLINQHNTTNMLIISLLAIYALIAWTKITYSKYFNQFLRSFFTYSEAIKLFFDQNALIDRVYSILNLIFILSGGIFLFLSGYSFISQMPSQSIYFNFVICLTIILLLYMFRYLTAKISGWLLYQHSSFNEYLHSSFLYFKSTGILLLPIITIAAFIDIDKRNTFLFIGCIIFLLTYLSSIYRGTKIMLKKGVLLFYWILYLCTVEFFPLVLLYKYLSSRA
jgi:hypothetical protein